MSLLSFPIKIKFKRLPSIFRRSKIDQNEQKKRRKGEVRRFEDDYTLTTTVLGKGAYATVYLGQSNLTEENVAVKVIDKSEMTERELRKLNVEVGILKRLNHRNIVRVYDAYDEGSEFLIVMEHVTGGELFKKIVNEEQQFTEDQSRTIIKTLAEALLHCKKKGIVHRDLKPENILLTSEEEGGEVKLVDFNLSKQVDINAVEFSILETMCGTPNYVAPEVISGRPYNHKCDIWSLGVISFLLLSGGYLPFFVNPKKEGRQDLLRKVKEGRWKFKPHKAWVNVSDPAKDLISKMLRKDPESRYSYEQILAHPWFKGSADFYRSRVIRTDRMEVFNDYRKQLLVNFFINEARGKFASLLEPESLVSLRELARPEIEDSGEFEQDFGLSELDY